MTRLTVGSQPVLVVALMVADRSLPGKLSIDDSAARTAEAKQPSAVAEEVVGFVLP
jgi:hypothetical protein